MTQPQILRITVTSPNDVKAERSYLAVVAKELNRNAAGNRGLRIEDCDGDTFLWSRGVEVAPSSESRPQIRAL